MHEMNEQINSESGSLDRQAVDQTQEERVCVSALN